MRGLVVDALKAGAVGFATSDSHNHFGDDGLPMPSRLATRAETDTLIGTLAEADHGIMQIASGPDIGVAEMEIWADMIKRPVFWSALLHIPAIPERATTMLAQAAAAQQRGRQVFAQVTGNPISMEFTLENAYLMGSHDVWLPLVGASPETVAAAIRDPEFRHAFRAGLAAPKPQKIFYGDWSRVQVAQVMSEDHREHEGETIGSLAARTGEDPADFFFDLALAEDLKTVFVAQMQNFDEEAVEKMIKHPASVLALSDAGAHLSFMCDAGYPLYLLSRWVREKQSLTLEEGIRQLTSDQADHYGIIGPRPPARRGFRRPLPVRFRHRRRLQAAARVRPARRCQAAWCAIPSASTASATTAPARGRCCANSPVKAGFVWVKRCRVRYMRSTTELLTTEATETTGGTVWTDNLV